MNIKSLVIPIISLLLAVAWIVLIYMPASSEITQLDLRYDELLEKQRDIISPLDISVLRAKIDSLSAGLQRRLASYYPEDKLLEMGSTLERIGKEYNLSMISVSPDHESLSLFISNQEISELPINVEYNGRFQDLTRFFDNMSEFPIAYRLKRTVIEKDPEKEGYLSILLKGIVVIKNTDALDQNTTETP
ncbi:type 4a pilus biogenesis protein PilO [bacterium]|nr:type 4a pilus biogenesis protein PilO [bacterium]